MPIKVLHIATGLGMGGAETSLANLVSFTDRREFDLRVLSLSDDKPVGALIRKSGIPVDSLGMRAGHFRPGDYFRLVRYIRTIHPDLIQTWMYHADFMVSLAAPLAGSPPIVWGIHLTVGDMSLVKRSTRAIIRMNALLSRWSPKRIVCCAEKTLSSHAALGYSEPKMAVIPNGFDPSTYRPDLYARKTFREELSLSPQTRLIGMGARFHPQKDHQNFISAAAHLHVKMPEVQFILWGKGINWDNRLLSGWIEDAGLCNNFHLLDLRLDAAKLNQTLDIASLSSISEAFPMVIGEAMACAIPCVVTDVGDSAILVGDTGRVVPPASPEKMACAWEELLKLPDRERSKLGERARQRIMDFYDIRKTAEQYADLYRDIMSAAYK